MDLPTRKTGHNPLREIIVCENWLFLLNADEDIEDHSGWVYAYLLRYGFSTVRGKSEIIIRKILLFPLNVDEDIIIIFDESMISSTLWMFHAVRKKQNYYPQNFTFPAQRRWRHRSHSGWFYDIFYVMDVPLCAGKYFAKKHIIY
jgi:hypothetical protein